LGLEWVEPLAQPVERLSGCSLAAFVADMSDNYFEEYHPDRYGHFGSLQPSYYLMLVGMFLVVAIRVFLLSTIV
jgi:hypothetical protein